MHWPPNHGFDARAREEIRAKDPPKGFFAKIAAKVRASSWISLAGKAGMIAMSLAVLAHVGRSSATTVMTPDAGDAANDTDAAVASPAPAPAPAPAPTIMPADMRPAANATRARASADDPVYLNIATTEDLRRLPGVGAKRADQILEFRRKLGRFQKIEQILQIKGIGRGALRKWRAALKLDPPITTATASAHDDAGARTYQLDATAPRTAETMAPTASARTL